jgi:hypothetical protein
MYIASLVISQNVQTSVKVKNEPTPVTSYNEEPFHTSTLYFLE